MGEQVDGVPGRFGLAEVRSGERKAPVRATAAEAGRARG